jgi:hypothetical protein
VTASITTGDYGTPTQQGGVLLRNPVSTNNQLPNRFRLQMKRAPNVEYWCQQVVIPGFSLPSVRTSTPFVDIPKPGDHIEFEDLGVSFLVDDQLGNYLEMFDWGKSLGFPDNFAQYAELLRAPVILDAGVTSEISVFILNGSQQPTFRFTFRNAFPFALGSLTLDSTDPGLTRLVCHVGFKFIDFHVEKIT